MIIAVQGTNTFNNYQVFLRAMAVALSSLPKEDPFFYIYTAGPKNVNDMVLEFTNLSEKGFKSRGKKIKFYKVAPEWINDNLDSINYFAFVSNPGEQLSKLASSAQLKNIEVGIYQY